MFVCDEVVPRYDVFKEEKNEMREIEYQSFVRSQYVERPPAPTLPHPVPTYLFEKDVDPKRYFPSFYASFQKCDKDFYDFLVDKTITAERKEREQLQGQELQELVLICRGFGRVLGGLSPQLLYINTLPLAEEETIARRFVDADYCSMLLEACQVEEELSRRTLVFAAEPIARRRLEASEVPAWIESRRLQVAREDETQIDEADKEKRRQIEYFKWRQQQQYQLFLYQQHEGNERLDLERSERLSAGIIAALYNSEYKEAYYRQLKYEVMTECLAQEQWTSISGDEASERSMVLLEQFDAFHRICASEVRSLLATHRNAAVNAYVEKM